MTKKKKILIADDEQDIRDSLEDLLSQDFQIVTAPNGEQAIAFLKIESFDLAILDIMMPKMDGYAIAQEMKKQNIDIPFIFLTAKTQIESKIKGLELGADDYITKPFSEKELLLRIKQKLITQQKIKLRNKRLKLMNHNIVTPAGVILGSSEILTELVDKMKKQFLATKTGKNSYIISKKNLDDIEKQFKDTLSLIHDSSDQLIKMVKNLTELFYEFEIQLISNTISLKKLIYDAITIFKPEKIKCQITDPIPEVNVDVDINRMNSVVYELLDNIVLHNPRATLTVTVNAKIEGDYALISFTDNGKGINEEDHQNIFEEFWSGYDEMHHTRGQGIGLWLCKKYINAHDGKIWIEKNHPGKGTTITLSLPLTE